MKRTGIIIATIIGVLLCGVCAILAPLAGSYNGFVQQQNSIDGQWKQVEVQYQRRFDLIPNLVETTKGLAEQEKEVFTNIAEARTRYSGASNPNERAAAATEVESALSRLLVIVENYPQLKSDQAFLRLQDELAGTENRIAVERQRYNGLVQEYNTSISVFPGTIAARIFGFDKRNYFEAAQGSENAPRVNFGNGTVTPTPSR